MKEKLKKPLLRASNVLGINSLLGNVVFTKNLYLVGYHSVTDPRTDDEFESWRYPEHVKIPKEQLEQELAWLTSQGHSFIGVHDIEEALNKNVYKPTVVYFDDGYRDTLRNALPIFEARNIPMAVYLVTELLDGTRRVLRGFTESEDTKFTPFINWEDAKELVRRGVTIGSHGVTHTKFTNLTEEALAQELRESKQALEDRLGVSIKTVSYPHGRATARIAELVKEAGYTYGLTTREGINTPNMVRAQPLLLNKIEPRSENSLADFKAKMYSEGIIAHLRKK